MCSFLIENKSLFTKIKGASLNISVCSISEMITTSCSLLAFISGFRSHWLICRISLCGCLNFQLWNALHTCTIQSHIASQIKFIANLLCNKMLHYVGLWLIAGSCNKLEGCGKKKRVFQQCASDCSYLWIHWLLYALVKWRFSVV